jgi:glutathione S-transferase
VKFYNSLGPNPRCVRMFMAEKGIDIPDKVELDLMGGENRRPPYTDKNPGGQMPALELDNGHLLAETVAVCEYLEDKYPTPALIGATPEEKAETRMWQRRIELNITENLYNGFRYGEGLKMFQNRMHCLPEAADGLKAIVREKLAWLDKLMEGKSFIVGERFTLPDIILYVALDFGAGVGQKTDPQLKNINTWFARVNARSSAAASLHEKAHAAGMRA